MRLLADTFTSLRNSGQKALTLFERRAVAQPVQSDGEKVLLGLDVWRPSQQGRGTVHQEDGGGQGEL